MVVNKIKRRFVMRNATMDRLAVRGARAHYIKVFADRD